MPSASPTKLPAWAFDLAVILCIGAYLWPAVLQLPVDPAAAGAYLNGPDAGEWALNAQMVERNDVANVDPHRMPTFLLVLVGMMALVDDVAPAGHLVAVISWALQPVALYLLGRWAGGRLVGILSAVIVMGCAPLVLEAAKFGVDPLLSLLLPAALAVALWSRRMPWPAAVGAGAVTAMACCTHLMALPYVFPALILALWPPPEEGPPARPLLRLLAFVLTVVGVVSLLDAVFDLISIDAYMRSISEGISRGTGGPGDTGLSDAARQQLKTGGSAQPLLGASHAALNPFRSPRWAWWLLVGALWAGVIGLGLRPGRDWPRTPPAMLRPWLGAMPERRWRKLQQGLFGRAVRLRSLLSSDLVVGLVLLSCLAPLPLLSAANAPERYGITLLPFVAVVLARGLGSAASSVARFAPARHRHWVVGGLGFSMVIFVGLNTHASLQRVLALVPRPGAVPRLALRLSAALDRVLPGSAAIASPMREVPAHLKRPHCPRTSCTPDLGGNSVASCLLHLRRRCPGDGPIPLIWLTEAPAGMGDDAVSQAVGEHAAATWGELARVREGEFEGVVLAIPRSD